MSKPVILTGLRANAEFHIGNYLGAILPMVELQKAHAGEYQVNMFVPDLHSFTTPIDHGKLYQQTLANLKLFVAAGLDINNADTYIYRQSYIPAHSELAWILSCFTSFAQLARMTEFKDKAARMKGQVKELFDVINDRYGKAPTSEEAIQNVTNENVTAGLFLYPVLMAADILLYDAKYIPVGEDQRQHLEFARDIAMKVNIQFNKEIFSLPVAMKEQVAFMNQNASVRIRSLRNPEKKMSKSVEDPAGTIMLSDSSDKAAKKIMSAETDSVGKIQIDWAKQPGISNLLQMSALLSGKPVEGIAKEWGGKNSYGELKQKVAGQVEAFLADLQGKLTRVDEKALLHKLEEDEKKMNEIANKTLLKVQKAVGLRP
jgi:tryptophanyl-tRNA synthetase